MSESVSETEVVKQQETEIRKPLPGAELLARREQLGWTVEEAADRMKMTARQIHALEVDDFAALPGLAITRGFVRAYAKAMQMDAEPLVAMLQEEASDSKKKKTPRPIRPAKVASYSDSRMPSLGNRNSATKKWSLGVVLVVVIIAALLLGKRVGWLPDFSKLSVLKKEATTKVAKTDEKTLKGEVAADEKKPLTDPNVVQKELPPIKPVAVLPAIDENTVKQAETSNTAEVEKNVLVLSCSEQSWYEFKRPDGLVLKSGLLKAGTSKSFTIDQPMQLTLGNAPAVEATLGGEKLEIKPINGRKTVKLNLK